jgi:hypothetical protein
MCDHVWIFEARTLSTQPVRRRCGMCGVYRMEPRCREPGTSTCSFPMTKTPLGEAATCLAVGEHCCGAVAGEPGQLGAAKDGWSSEWNKNPTSQNCLPGPILGWIIQPT